MTTGEKITYLRTKAKISQEQLAERLDVSRQSVSKWEQDQAHFYTPMDTGAGDELQRPFDRQRRYAEAGQIINGEAVQHILEQVPKA